ncbi:hypothetical protein F6R98_08620 [Candidatus Methylospira mobilis]|uniref:ATP-binding protein n=1 Tax=Candidatus Methylospira mobilis TaxID=1808979 RepID=A0A5Q0BFT4_9GAMM|nr:hypothetical protein [Candidatus Methylospira mobilis]QFY42680.1 hypothetical protein F6R98_08620 [Candidatus Methylospira mobilis]
MNSTLEAPTCDIEKMPVDTEMHIENGDDHSFSAPEIHNDVQQVQEVQPDGDRITDLIESAELATDPNAAIITDMLARLADDCGAVFETEVVAAMRALQEEDKPEFMRLRAKIKKINPDALLKYLDKAIRGDSGESDDQSLSGQLVEFVQERAELFHDQDKSGYASFPAGDHREAWRLDSKGFAEWLDAEFYRESKIIPKEAPLRDACLALNGIAKYDGEQKEVSIRVAKTDTGYAVDLVNDAWQSVSINAGSWRVDSSQAVVFRRTSTMRALPLPLAAGAGNIELLWQCINCAESARNMLLAWMLECLRSDTAFPVFEIVAEQGSGKSKVQYFIRELIDPNQVNLRGRPKTIEDIYISATNSWLTSFENLSHLTDDMQDAFCVLATGGGFAGRTLYTNAEETAVSVKRPIAMNGISVLATRQDLVDRLVHVEIEPISASQRKTETELDALFDSYRAAIFTGLLDLFAAALEILPTIQIEHLPRMADFAMLGAAVYAARGVENPTQAFMDDYNGMRKESIHRTLESSPIAGAIQAYLELYPYGTEFLSGKLALDALQQFKNDGDGWPKSAKGFADAIRRLSPALRVIGIRAEVAKKRGEHGYPVTIKPIKQTTAVHPVLAVHENKFSSAKNSPPENEVQAGGRYQESF